MRYDDQCYAKLASDGADVALKRTPRESVERRERLVQKERIRRKCERAGKSDALLLAPGKVLHVAVREIAQLDKFQKLETRARASRPLPLNRNPRDTFPATLSHGKSEGCWNIITHRGEGPETKIAVDPNFPG